MTLQTIFETKLQNPSYPQVCDISAAELNGKKEQVCIVDVRQADEFSGELGHIPDAKLIPLNILPEQIEELPKNQTIVFVCRSGGRSARATAFALQSGIDDVYNLKGGMLHWNELQFETER